VGISTVAASLALRNRSGVSSKTRKRVLQVAKKLGYVPDPRIASWMARMREAKSKAVLPIAWLNSMPAERAWQDYSFLSPYFIGAQQRAHKLGYCLDEIWSAQPGMSMKRISQILDRRGIEGVIVSQPARHVRLNWERLAAVSVDGFWMAPGIDRVMTDNAFNLSLSLKSLKRLGFRRIGVFLTEDVDRATRHFCRAVANDFLSTIPPSDRVEPHFYGDIRPNPIAGWLKYWKPEVVVGLDNRLVSLITDAGYRVPEDVGVVHLSLDDDVIDWTGIYSNKRAVGAGAVERVVAMIQNNLFGLPEIALTTLVPGSWRNGRTTRNPVNSFH
jgi:LacI family transcriptional regulator